MRYITQCREHGTVSGSITMEQWQRFVNGANTGPLRKGDRQMLSSLSCHCGLPMQITLKPDGFVSDQEIAAMKRDIESGVM